MHFVIGSITLASYLISTKTMPKCQYIFANKFKANEKQTEKTTTENKYSTKILLTF